VRHKCIDRVAHGKARSTPTRDARNALFARPSSFPGYVFLLPAMSPVRERLTASNRAISKPNTRSVHDPGVVGEKSVVRRHAFSPGCLAIASPVRFSGATRSVSVASGP